MATDPHIRAGSGAGRRKLEKRIKRKLRKHLSALGIANGKVGGRKLKEAAAKQAIRTRHLGHRQERLEKAAHFISKSLQRLMPYFASGSEVVPERISPRIAPVASGTLESELFRLASLTWSVPVSEGYGRRMRFLVWDDFNGKLIGLFALGDPVFNLHVRDRMIGWSVADRKDRLVGVMDGYVLGAVSPYNMLLGGKLVACLVRTQEVRDLFAEKYGGTFGIISGKSKHAKLLLVTTTSSLGRSSLYNRLRLGGVEYFRSIGYTSGFGHFHVPSPLFEEMRDYLRLSKHSYHNGNRFGNGPNWKFRSIRAALELMGVGRDLLKHGIHREVFACKVAENAHEILRGEQTRPNYRSLLSVREVGELALERWLCPRSHRRPEFKNWRREDFEKGLSAACTV